tara:strand:- start:180 stop:869 length:690 start_codon:yes stop_codon:yes gene_type:complete
LLNTSDSIDSKWLAQQEAIIASLQRQPFLLVVRPQLDDPLNSQRLLDQLKVLHDADLCHVEVAWSSHAGWRRFVREIQGCCPRFHVGAASVVAMEALPDLKALDLAYAMAPCWDPSLVSAARDQGQLLIPGVLSPTEVQQAVAFGCRVVKLFPAVTVGVEYWKRLEAPLGPLPFVVAAGGLTTNDLSDWLGAGHDAVALGRRAIGDHGFGDECVDPELLGWLKRSPTSA